MHSYLTVPQPLLQPRQLRWDPTGEIGMRQNEKLSCHEVGQILSYPERLWDLHLWRHSGLNGHSPEHPDLGALGRGLDSRAHQRGPFTLKLLWN